MWSCFCINRNSAKTLRGLPGKTGLEFWFRFDLLSQFRSVLNATSKMPPKKLPRLEKGQRTLFGSASSEGGTSESTTTSRTFRTAWLNPPSFKTSCWLSSWASGSSWCLEGCKAQGCTGLKPQTYPPLLPPPPPSHPHPPTHSLSQSLTLFPPLLLPLLISHPLICCPPVHNLHLSSQLLPAFTVFKRTF